MVRRPSSTTIFGSNNTTPGAATAPSTLLTDNTTNTGLTIQAGGASPPTGQVAIRVLTSAGTRVWDTQWDGVSTGYNMRIGAAFGFFFQPVNLNGQQNPPCAELPDGGASNQVWRCWSGTGTPGSGTVGAARVGDWYLRRDTPSTTNQRLYVCTVAGSPGTWSGIA